MAFSILFMIIAFITGIIFDHFYSGKKSKISNILQQAATIYLLFKIGFLGGQELVSQQLQTVLIQSIVAIIASSIWTFLLLTLIKRWCSFDRITRISIATHFGSVSVGTFIAGIAFLDAMKINVNHSAVIWLTIMEFPAIIIGMWKFGVRSNSLISIIKEKWTLAILPISTLLGALFGKYIPDNINFIIFTQLFTPILLYFLFEMGRKASDNLHSLKKNTWSILFIGIIIPIIGGTFGASIGYLMGYNISGMFIMAILMASASYVLAPLCTYEVLKNLYQPNLEIAKQAVSTSMALSIGVTLPFNILIGFELYYIIIKALQAMPILYLFGLGLPLIFGLLSMDRLK